MRNGARHLARLSDGMSYRRTHTAGVGHSGRWALGGKMAIMTPRKDEGHHIRSGVEYADTEKSAVSLHGIEGAETFTRANGTHLGNKTAQCR